MTRLAHRLIFGHWPAWSHGALRPVLYCRVCGRERAV